MEKKTIRDIELDQKFVFVRVDYNVPLDKDYNITDTSRIDATLPTLNYLISKNAKIILASHLGRPKGNPDSEYSLKPVFNYLKTLFNNVKFANDSIGPQVDQLRETMVSGDILLLENVRFYNEETENDPEFSKSLVRGCSVFVNDAFGTSHRAHSSTSGVSKFVDESVSGLLIEKELQFLSAAIDKPKRPLTAIIGGAKISGKIDVIQNLFDKVDHILIGGGMVFTFYKAMGMEIGKSLVELDKVDMALELIEKAKLKNVRLLLPTDIICADSFSEKASISIKKSNQINKNDMGLDIGPDSISLFSKTIEDSKTIIWNGPMGAFELTPFENGTKEIAIKLGQVTEKGAITIIGGGDSAAAVHKFNLSDKMSHISTGGGASLEFLEGKELPGISVLNDKN